MFDQTDDQEKAVQLRWITYGFAASGLGLALLVVDSTLEMGFILSFAPQIRKILVSPVWAIMVGGPISFLTFIGSYLLWSSTKSRSWRQFSTLLLLMNSVHIGLWIADHHSQIGLPDQKFDHHWLRTQISQILNWMEFLLWIKLVEIHTDNVIYKYQQNSDLRPRFGLSWIGLLASIAIATGLTDWSSGWPLVRVRWLNPLDSLMLATLSTMLTLFASFQIMIYLMKSARLAYFCQSIALPEAEAPFQWFQEDWDDDPWNQIRRN